jgi:putative sigma-54 modulation protein
MYAAIDGLVDKIDRQVKKHKEKKTNHRNGAVPKRTDVVES